MSSCRHDTTGCMDGEERECEKQCQGAEGASGGCKVRRNEQVQKPVVIYLNATSKALVFIIFFKSKSILKWI